MWVARDKDGHLFLWDRQPERGGTLWIVKNTVLQHWFEIDASLFPDLKWEDEPIEIEIHAKK